MNTIKDIFLIFSMILCSVFCLIFAHKYKKHECGKLRGRYVCIRCTKIKR